MTLRLIVDTPAWERHVAAVVAATRDAGVDLVPVVKGNGYGFGRSALAERAAGLANTLAVGTVHEVTGTPDGVDIVVLTPTVRPPDLARDAILTVGATAHLDALDGRPTRVLVKVESSMRRYGRPPAEARALAADAERRGHSVVGWSIHPPLAGHDDAHRAEVAELIGDLPAGTDVWVSHLSPRTAATLPATHRYHLRIGTALWHGDKSMLRLSADVLDARRVPAGQAAGYRSVPMPVDGTLVMIGAGTAHGVTPLPDGRSPFHHARRRLALLEPPHMHTSMAVVPDGDPVPSATVDVQRPLTTTMVDEIDWTGA